MMMPNITLKNLLALDATATTAAATNSTDKGATVKTESVSTASDFKNIVVEQILELTEAPVSTETKAKLEVLSNLITDETVKTEPGLMEFFRKSIQKVMMEAEAAKKSTDTESIDAEQEVYDLIASLQKVFFSEEPEQNQVDKLKSIFIDVLKELKGSSQAQAGMKPEIKLEAKSETEEVVDTTTNENLDMVITSFKQLLEAETAVAAAVAAAVEDKQPVDESLKKMPAEEKPQKQPVEQAPVQQMTVKQPEKALELDMLNNIIQIPNTKDIQPQAVEQKSIGKAEIINQLKSMIKKFELVQDKSLPAVDNSMVETLKTLVGNLEAMDSQTDSTIALFRQLITMLDFTEKPITQTKEAAPASVVSLVLGMLTEKTNELTKTIANSDSSDADAGMKKIIEEILTTIVSKEGISQKETETSIEQLVSNLLIAPAKDSEMTLINSLMKKYGLAETVVQTSSKGAEVEDFKVKLTRVLVLMASEMKSNKVDKAQPQKISAVFDQFTKVIEKKIGEVPTEATPKQQHSLKLESKAPTTVAAAVTAESVGAAEQPTEGQASIGDKVVNGKPEKLDNLQEKENKLLRNILNSDSQETDKKADKVTNFIQHLNNSKGDLKETPMIEKPAVVTKTNFTHDIIKTVKFMSMNNLKELTVKIMPKELGEITIRLTMSEGTIKASIAANNKDAYNLLSSNVSEITASLSNTDIKIQDVNISIYQEDASFLSDNSNGHNSRQPKENKNQKVELPIDMKEEQFDITEDGNISILA